FRPGDTHHLIAAVWDGTKLEVNGRKSVTMSWTPISLGTTIESAGSSESAPTSTEEGSGEAHE
ncbi:MAG: hypothetical protein ACRD1Z_00320, partial [Vicinamibacteria bacterium]